MRVLQQKLLSPLGRISDSPMLWLLDMLLILSSLFLSLTRHVHSQTHYQNQVRNAHTTPSPTKIGLCYSKTSIMSFGKQGFFDWIIPATIHIGNPAYPFHALMLLSLNYESSHCQIRLYMSPLLLNPRVSWLDNSISYHPSMSEHSLIVK